MEVDEILRRQKTGLLFKITKRRSASEKFNKKKFKSTSLVGVLEFYLNKELKDVIIIKGQDLIKKKSEEMSRISTAYTNLCFKKYFIWKPEN